MAVGRVRNGTLKIGQRVAIVREEAEDADGSVEPGRTATVIAPVTALQTAKGIERVDIGEAGPGDIVSVAGLPEVTIGDTLTDPADPRPLPRLDVDAPTLRMTFGVNTSPMAGRDGTFLTSRQIKARLDREVLGNTAIEVHPTESGDTYEVRGRGELQLAVLIEQMRREGFELTVSRPEVIERDGQEPYERVTIDIPPDYIGVVQQAMAARKGRLEQMSTDADGRARLEFIVPTRGLIGYRGQLLSDTRGTALLHQIGEGYGPMAGEVTHRTSGVLVADRTGESRAYALSSLVERSELFIGPSAEVYEGMIIGENSRPDDMDVNPTKSKALSKMRTQATDGDYRIHTPPRVLTLESAIEFIAADELVEVTPTAIRLRKRLLSQHDRRRAAGAAFKAGQRDSNRPGYELAERRPPPNERAHSARSDRCARAQAECHEHACLQRVERAGEDGAGLPPLRAAAAGMRNPGEHAPDGHRVVSTTGVPPAMSGVGEPRYSGACCHRPSRRPRRRRRGRHR